MRKSKEWVYRCDYCNKHFHNSTYCKTHETNCFYNVKNTTCITCLHSGYGCTRPKEDMVRSERTKISDQLYTNCSRWQLSYECLEEQESDN